MSLHPQSQQYVDDFLKAIEPIKDAYQDDTFGYLALKTAAGFVMIQGTLFLNVAPRIVPCDCFESQNIRAAHHHLSKLHLSREQLIEQICSGHLKLPEGELLFPPNDGGSHGSMYQPFHAAGTQTQSRLGVLSLFGANRVNFDQVALDWELRGATKLYDGLQDLMNDYQLGVPRGGGTYSVEGVAYNVAAIDLKSHVEGESANIGIRVAKGLTIDRATIGFRVLEQNKVVKRGSISIPAAQWKDDGEYRRGAIEIKVPRAAVVQCTACYSGLAQHYFWFGDPSAFQNPRRAAYETVDPGGGALREILDKSQERNPDGRKFEAAISWLLWMLGFDPAHFGAMPRTQEAPDLLVSTPSGHFAVVECTTGLLKANNKLPKVHDRAQALRRNLDTSNASHLRVLPIIVTSKTLDEIRLEIKQAEEHGIYVLTREGIENLLARTLVPLNADKIYQEAEEMVRAAIERGRQEILPQLFTGEGAL
jgi:hypothetical protein